MLDVQVPPIRTYPGLIDQETVWAPWAEIFNIGSRILINQEAVLCWPASDLIHLSDLDFEQPG